MIIPNKARKYNKNAEYGLSYHMLPVKRESVDKLRTIKAKTGQPFTYLIDLAIEQFLKTAKPSV